TTAGNYTTTAITCDNSVTPSPNNNTSGSVAIPAGFTGTLTCTFNNTRKTVTLKVVKSLSPSNDPGLWELSIAGNVVTGNAGVGNIGNGSTTVNAGDTASITRPSHSLTTASNYTTTAITCDNSVTPS